MTKQRLGITRLIGITYETAGGYLVYTLFDVGKARLTRGIPDGVARVITDNDPIKAMS